jgi:predicted Fe-Mo cluster-binding NifX family protein
MKMAVSTWNGRISPVFDVSRQMVVVEIEKGAIRRKHEQPIDEDLGQKVERIAGDGIQLLICGAISQSLAEMLAMRGVQIIPFIAGNVDEVIQACLSGGLDRSCFAMPGCCGRHQHRFRTKRCGNTGL